MNVASLELCKELYELSGWVSTHSIWYWSEDYDCIDDSEDIVTCRQSMSDKKAICPAYDLGYLLRKLPMRLPIGAALDDDVAYFFRLSEGMEDKWQIDYRDGFDGQYTAVVAPTPEDAACKLAIELFKQGVLKS